jgi:hypothetical protein
VQSAPQAVRLAFAFVLLGLCPAHAQSHARIRASKACPQSFLFPIDYDSDTVHSPRSRDGFTEPIAPRSSMETSLADQSAEATTSPVPTPTSVSSPTPGSLALPSPALSIKPIPSPSPSIPPLPSAIPSVVPSPIAVPTVSIPPRPAPPPAATPAFPVPAPNPAPVVSVAAPPAPASVSSAPSFLYLQHLTPVVEVWHSDALTPELPVRRGRYLSPVLVAPSETLIVRLQFGPQAAGKSVIVTPGPGVVANPSQQVFVLSSTADCAVSVTLGQGYLHGAVSFYCEGLTTKLPLGRGIAAAASSSPVPGGTR